ncbi:hypothetical protein AN214_00073 [Pseudoalteromonas sp. P1-9]|uniref:hypothetical protein n=1 Tax=Pseudoalteromonas sp. P1-9 TaxID=1710354 RepID=UPI0006D610E6|nr:hypothetical protein [Pseudoalteromonas sp. P1-9]KPV98312.1 hypothetical protein AN214_00073 [Pseudoalteromonas sp. P1-9]
MNKLKILKWCIATSLIVVALIFVNTALFNYWNTGLADAREFSWNERSQHNLMWAFSCILFAIVFIKNTQSKVKVWLAVAALSISITPFINEFFHSDTCLDSGGSWNYSKYVCDY